MNLVYNNNIICSCINHNTILCDRTSLIRKRVLWVIIILLFYASDAYIIHWYRTVYVYNINYLRIDGSTTTCALHTIIYIKQYIVIACYIRKLYTYIRYKYNILIWYINTYRATSVIQCSCIVSTRKRIFVFDTADGNYTYIVHRLK